VTTWLERVIAEAVKLAGAGGAGLLVVLVLLLGGAVMVVLAKQVGDLRLPPPSPEPKAPEAEWNTDPGKGAVVVPGPPGGSDDPVQGG